MRARRTPRTAGRSTTRACSSTCRATSTPNRTEPLAAGSGGAFAPPLPFLLFPLLLGIFAQGGDWPPATFLIRGSLFVLAAIYLIRHDTITIRPNAVDLLVAAFWLLTAISLPRAGYRWISYQWFLHHSAALILYLLWRAAPDPDGRLPKAFGMLVVVAGGAELVLAGIQRVLLGEGRPTGTWENPNFLAEFLVYGGAAAYCIAGARGAAGRRWRPALVAFFAGGIVLTWSRGGFVIALATAAYLLAGRFGWKRAIAGASVAACLLLVLAGTLLDRFLGKGDPFAFERLAMWKAAVRIFADHPFGVGTGHFKYYWAAARDPVEGSLIRYARHTLTPHSEFFSVLSELGLPGAALFLGLGAAGLLSLRRAGRAAGAAPSAAAAILLASYLHSFLQTNYHIIGLLLLNAAALAIVSGRHWQPVREWRIRVRGPVRPAVLALLAAMAGYSGMTLCGHLLAADGRAALAAGRFGEAERRFVQAAAADPWQAGFPDSASAVQYRLFESGGGDDALSRAVESEMDAAIRNPLEPRYPARLGFLYATALDRFPEARRGVILGASLAAYDKAIRLSPRSAEMRYRKAVLLQAAGREAEARRTMEEVLRDEPRFARGWAFLGGVLEEVAPEEAAAAYRKALGLYYNYGKMASDAEEKEFLSLDVEAVEKRLRELGSCGR